MIANQASSVSLDQIFAALRPLPASYLAAVRQIEQADFKTLRPVKVAVLATFTANLLKPYLIVEGARRGLRINTHFAPFNQLEQQVLNPASDFHEFDSEVVVIATRIEDLAPDLINRFLSLSGGEISAQLSQIRDRLESLIQNLRRAGTATILVYNFAPPAISSSGLADPHLEPSLASVIQQANSSLSDLCQNTASAYVFDQERLVNEIGLQRWHDPKLWYLGRIPFGVEAQLATGRQLARYLRALLFPPCKCLVLDLDNTLWGGILGEEGVGGVALGEDYPGNVFKDFQRYLLMLRDRGTLLAIASKNNDSDVLELFAQHPDCVLKIEDFAARRVNWQDKATSLASIAQELNIGTDSLAFFDDNPVEREWIRSQMPEVTVIDVPPDSLGYITALDSSGAFDYLSISEEDRQRAELYQQEQLRQQSQNHSSSLEEFLKQLDTTAIMGLVNSDTLPRVAQLGAKTNQFTLTTRRYTPSEIRAMIDSGAIALWLRVTDRYGDNGLVGVAIAQPGAANEWTIDSFLMSCRVIGRGVETVLLQTLSKLVLEKQGQVLWGQYILTPQNGMVSEFYPAHGFDPVAAEGHWWKLNLADQKIPIPDYVTVNFTDGTG